MGEVGRPDTLKLQLSPLAHLSRSPTLSTPLQLQCQHSLAKEEARKKVRRRKTMEGEEIILMSLYCSSVDIVEVDMLLLICCC